MTASSLWRPLPALRTSASPLRAVLARPAVVPASAFVLSAIVYTVLGIRAQALGRTGTYDLGIFVQGVRGYAEGTGPISAIKGPGFNLLGDHFSPVTALIAPFYAVFPSPSTLLVAQALLVASSTVPLALYAARTLGSGAAAVVTFSYAASFGVASAVAFDFHEVAFAVPLVVCSAVALAEQRWRTAAAWAVPLVLVKEDLGLTVAAIGAIIAWRGPRRLGFGLAVFGVLATAIEVLLIIPAFNPGGSYSYSGQVGGGASSLLHTAFQNLDLKGMTVFLTLAVTGFLALRSPVVWILLPTFAWRFVNAKASYWGTEYHYSILPMAVVFVALVHALWILRSSGVDRRVVRWALGVVLATTVLLIPSYPFGSLFHRADWTPDARASVLDDAEALVPDGATVATSGWIGPQLVDRTTVSYLWDPAAVAGRPEWIIADLANPGPWVTAGPATDAVVTDAESNGYARVFSEQNVVVLRRN